MNKHYTLDLSEPDEYDLGLFVNFAGILFLDNRLVSIIYAEGSSRVVLHSVHFERNVGLTIDGRKMHSLFYSTSSFLRIYSSYFSQSNTELSASCSTVAGLEYRDIKSFILISSPIFRSGVYSSTFTDMCLTEQKLLEA